jgi:hypothetical protein
MAENYVVQSQRRAVQVLSQTQVIDIMEVGAATIPHAVFFQVEVPYADWLAGYSVFSLGVVAEFIEGAFSQPYVVGASFVQDTDESGLLRNAIAFVLQVTPEPGSFKGVQQTTAIIPYGSLPLSVDYAAMFKPYLDALTSTAAL